MPALVEPAVFEAAQHQLDENRRHRREHRRRPGWLLQGLTVCRRCGYAFYGKMARGRVGGRKTAEYGYYRCLGTDGHRFGGTAVCDNRSVCSDRLERAVWNEIRALLEDPQRLADEYRRRLDVARTGGGQQQEQAAMLDRRIAGLRRGIDRLIDGYAEGLIDRDEFQPRITGLRQRRLHLQEQRQALLDAADAERSLVLVIGHVEEFAVMVRRGLEELDWQGTREIIRALVRRVEIDGDAVEVVFRIPPLPPDHDPGRPGLSPRESDSWQHCGCGHRGLIGEDADHRGPALDLLVRPLQRVRRMQLGPMLHWEGHVSQDVRLTLIDEGGELGPARAMIGGAAPIMVGHLPEGLPRRLRL